MTAMAHTIIGGQRHGKNRVWLSVFHPVNGKKLYQQKQMVTMIHFQVLNAQPCLPGPIPLTQWDSSSGLIVTQRMEQQPRHHQGKAEQRKEQTHEAVSSFIILLYIQCLASLQNHFHKPNSEYSVTYCFKVTSRIYDAAGLHRLGNETGMIIVVINNTRHTRS